MLVKSVKEEVVANVCFIMEVKQLNNIQLYVESSVFFSDVFQHSCREFLGLRIGPSNGILGLSGFVFIFGLENTPRGEVCFQCVEHMRIDFDLQHVCNAVRLMGMCGKLCGKLLRE